MEQWLSLPAMRQWVDPRKETRAETREYSLAEQLVTGGGRQIKFAKAGKPIFAYWFQGLFFHCYPYPDLHALGTSAKSETGDIRQQTLDSRPKTPGTGLPSYV
jgi:hypothetical protein